MTAPVGITTDQVIVLSKHVSGSLLGHFSDSGNSIKSVLVMLFCIIGGILCVKLLASTRVEEMHGVARRNRL